MNQYPISAHSIFLSALFVFIDKNITNSESNFCFRIVWPLMELLSNDDIIFKCGEYILNSMKEEYHRRTMTQIKKANINMMDTSYIIILKLDFLKFLVPTEIVI